MAAVTFDDEPPPAAAAAAPAAGGAVTFDDKPPASPRQQEVRDEALKKLVEGHGKPGVLDRAIDQYTMGLVGPAVGLNTALEGKVNEWFKGGKPATFGEYFQGGYGAHKDYLKQAEENTKGLVGTVADIAGAVAGGSGGPRIIGRGAQAAQAFARGAIGGAARNAEDPESAAKGAVLGGTVDAAGTTVLNGLLDRFTRGARRDIGIASRGGSGQQMTTDAGNIFETLQNAGIRYSPSETAPLAGAVAQRLADAGFNANMHRQLIPVLGEIGDASGQPMTWQQLRNMQTQISDLRAHADPRIRRIASELSGEVDNFINTARPTMPAASVAQGVNPAADVATARELYATGKYSNKIEGMAEVAANAKNPADATSSVFQKYSDSFVKNPDKYRPGTPEQWRLMDTIGAGDPATSAAAKGLDRWGNNLIGYGTAGAAAGVGVPYLLGGDSTGAGGVSSNAGLAAAAAGLAMKGGSGGLKQMIAERGAERVNDLLRNIATGQTAVQPGAYIPRDALARILAKQNLAQGLGNYAASFPNTGMPQP